MTDRTVPLPAIVVRQRPAAVLAALAAVLCLAILLGISVGAVPVPAGRIPAILWSFADPAVEVDAGQRSIVALIRLPRVLLGLVVGASLGMAGLLTQALFRNPLADPGLIGVAGGAALAAVATIVLGTAVMGGPLARLAGPYFLPIAAFLGALAATTVIFRLASDAGRVAVATLLLIGVAVNALAMTGIGFLTYVSDDQQLRTLTFWTMGALGSASWPMLSVALPASLLILLASLRFAPALDLLQLGEAEARHLGVDVERLKRRAVIAVALLAGIAVASAGIVGFVGLVVPHLVRLLTGPGHRWVAPGSALLGAGLVLLADVLARIAVAPAELPIGLVTSALGAPFFLWLLVRRRREIG